MNIKKEGIIMATSTMSEMISHSFKTVIEMLTDRGYDMQVDKNAMFESLSSDFNKSTFNVILSHRIHLVYHMGSKFKYSEIKNYLEDADNNGASLVILIVNDNITSANIKQLSAHKTPKEIHHVKNLQINISKHCLVPKHEIIREQDEIKSIMEQFSLKNKHQLPIILKTDAMARYLGLKSGDIVKITRKSPTAGVYVVYRVCV